MGGNAVELPVRVDEPRLRSVTIAAAPLWRRLLGHSGFRARQTHQGYEIHSSELRRTALTDFERFLRAAMSQPWPATKLAMSYTFGHPRPAVFIIKANAAAAEASLILRFSSAAGVAQISSDVAAHWAASWLNRDRDGIIREVLAPFGVTAGKEPVRSDPAHFAPTSDLGYASYNPDVDEERGLPVCFEIDDSHYESAGEGEIRTCLETVSQRVGPLMTDGRCRCQLCMPEFDTSLVAC